MARGTLCVVIVPKACAACSKSVTVELRAGKSRAQGQSIRGRHNSFWKVVLRRGAGGGCLSVLQVNITGRFAFVEFRMPEYATAALQLNGQIALMGNTLKIARPSSYVEPSQVGCCLSHVLSRGPSWGFAALAAALAPGGFCPLPIRQVSTTTSVSMELADQVMAAMGPRRSMRRWGVTQVETRK